MSDTCGRVNSSSETRKTKRAEKNGAKKSKDLRGWGKFDLNTDRCGRGNFYNPKEKVADSKISRYEWTGPKS